MVFGRWKRQFVPQAVVECHPICDFVVVLRVSVEGAVPDFAAEIAPTLQKDNRIGRKEICKTVVVEKTCERGYGLKYKESVAGDALLSIDLITTVSSPKLQLVAAMNPTQ